MFDHDRPAVWAALERVDQYPRWWPWLSCDGRSLADGAPWACTIRAPLPYSLHFDLDVVDVVHERLVRAELTGDLIGDARLTLEESEHGASCTVRLESSLEAVAGPARLLARFTPPLARFGHDWVLDAGARRFRSLALGDDAR